MAQGHVQGQVWSEAGLGITTEQGGGALSEVVGVLTEQPPGPVREVQAPASVPRPASSGPGPIVVSLSV